jgi:hypothetical protein
VGIDSWVVDSYCFSTRVDCLRVKKERILMKKERKRPGRLELPGVGLLVGWLGGMAGRMRGGWIRVAVVVECG